MAKIKLSVHDVKPNDKFGRLTVLSCTPFFVKNGVQNKAISKCKCDCGEIVNIPTRRLRDIRSCGCIRKETWHHKSKSDIYGIWQNIKARCLFSWHKQYNDYGGRGIRICEGFLNFLHYEKVMGVRPSKKHSTDRINNDGHYCCGECKECIFNGWGKNVRWATPSQQSANKRTTFYVYYGGEKMCLSDAARKYGISQSVLWSRLVKLKWNIDAAITVPTKSKKRNHV